MEMQRANRRSAQKKVVLAQSVVLFCIAVLGSSALSQQRYEATIRGTIVDQNGQPANAAVTFNNPESIRTKDCWVKDTTVFTDRNGQFSLREHCGLSVRNVTLFVEPATGFEGAQTPIRAPYWTSLRETKGEFSGLNVRLEKNQDVDLGSIPLKVNYRRVQLAVLGKNGKPYYKSRDDWAKFVLIVRNPSGIAVGSEALSTNDRENSVDLKRGVVLLALPEGTWTLELLKNWIDFDQSGRTLRYLARDNIIVKNQPVTRVSLLVR
jgi:hypothetical protein